MLLASAGAGSQHWRRRSRPEPGVVIHVGAMANARCWRLSFASGSAQVLSKGAIGCKFNTHERNFAGIAIVNCPSGPSEVVDVSNAGNFAMASAIDWVTLALNLSALTCSLVVLMISFAQSQQPTCDEILRLPINSSPSKILRGNASCRSLRIVDKLRIMASRLPERVAAIASAICSSIANSRACMAGLNHSLLKINFRLN